MKVQPVIIMPPGNRRKSGFCVQDKAYSTPEGPTCNNNATLGNREKSGSCVQDKAYSTPEGPTCNNNATRQQKNLVLIIRIMPPGNKADNLQGSCFLSFPGKGMVISHKG